MIQSKREKQRKGEREINGGRELYHAALLQSPRPKLAIKSGREREREREGEKERKREREREIALYV